jgi:hypothetical protein
MTAKEAAEGLYGALVHELPAETLTAYGVAAGADVRAVSAEAFLLSVFWTHSAIFMMQKPAHARAIWDALTARITSAWQREGRQLAAEAFWRDWPARQAACERLNRSGAGPHGVAADAANRLVESGTLSEDERPAALALFLDQIPVDELGELATEIQLTA